MSKAKNDYNKAYRGEYSSFSECEKVLEKGEIYIKEFEDREIEVVEYLLRLMIVIGSLPPSMFANSSDRVYLKSKELLEKIKGKPIKEIINE